MRVMQVSGTANLSQQSLINTPESGDVLYFGFMHSRDPTPRSVTAMSGCGAMWTRINGAGPSRVYWYRGDGANTIGTVTMTLDGSFTGGCMLAHLRPTHVDEDLTSLSDYDFTESLVAGTTLTGPPQDAHRGQVVLTLAQGGNPLALTQQGGLYTPVAMGSSAFMDCTWALPIIPDTVTHQIDLSGPSAPYRGITQIVVGDTDPGPTPIRLCFSDLAYADNTPAFSAGWGDTEDASRYHLRMPPAGTSTDVQSVDEVSAVLIDVLAGQFTSPANLPAKTFAGSFRFVMAAEESGDNADMSMQCRVKIVSEDATVERGILFDGLTVTGVSSNPADASYELPVVPNELSRIMERPLIPQTVQATDRLVVEMGVRAYNTSALSRGANLYIHDIRDRTDFPYTVDVAPGATPMRPWFELDLIDSPTVPLNVACSGTIDTITLTWDDPGGFGVPDFYEVRIDGGGWVNIGDTNSHTFTGLPAETAHTVEVRASNDAGTSAAATCETTTAPVPAPGGVSCTSTASSVTLVWEAVSASPPVTGYEVRIDGGTPIAVGDVLTYTFTGLDPATTYVVEVRATNEAGNSAYVMCTTDTLTPDCPECAMEWVVEGCDLRTGIVRTVLTPRGFTFQPSLNAPSQGTLTLTTREVKARDIWPWLSMIAFTRVNPDDPDTPLGVWLGIVDTFDAGDDGTTTVGLIGIEGYLWRRNLRETMEFTGVQQTIIGRTLANYTSGQIPLTAVAETSTVVRDALYHGWERAKVGDLITNLTQFEDGPDWDLTYTRTDGAWSAVITFRDHVGGDRNVLIRHDVEAAGYGLTVDGSGMATLVDAVGEGAEEAQLVATAEDDFGYPQLDVVTAYNDVGVQSVLQDHADGDLDRMREPAAIVSPTITGYEDIPITSLRIGDEVDCDIDFGLITYVGKGRVIDIAYAMGDAQPDTRTLGIAPISRASEAVLNQDPTDDCEEC